MNRLLTAFFLVALLLGTGLSHGAHAQDAATPPASPMAGDMAAAMSGTAAAFMTITNAGDAPDQLIAARAPVAAIVEIHEIVADGDVMQMRPLAAGLPLPAGETVTLAPGGYHVMLIGLTESLTPGLTYDLTLTFAEAGEVVVPVVVQAAAPTAAAPVTAGNLTIEAVYTRPAPMLSPATPVA